MGPASVARTSARRQATVTLRYPCRRGGIGCTRPEALGAVGLEANMSSDRLRPVMLLATVVTVGCQTQANTPQALSGAPHPLAAARHASSSSELYVSDDSGTIYVFPIQNGLPGTTPARTLATGMELLNVAVASDGTIFAAGQLNDTPVV